ncbi:MAG: type I-G CRISPR-associated helicase/endonuclease Cas3g [Solirubrobacteraceae bacterium]
MALVDRFAEFFAAANGGARPYPWQCALAEEVADTGSWPDIGAPTGSGKSSVIDVHAFLVTEHASGRLRVRPPRRLVLVAPRRVLVDDQFERATKLAVALAKADPNDEPALAAAAATLRELCTSVDSPASPLGVWRLRGGVRLETGWRLEPAACQVICATPQMWGSRLLLRGYGASRASRNLESGLLAHDAVAIVDEAHLHERLVETGRNLAARSHGPASLQVVAMSATARPGPGQIGLSDFDVADPALSRRVNAVKRIETVAVDDLSRGGDAALVTAARNAAGRGTVGVFVNDVPTALRVAGALAEDRAAVELVCGRMRPADLQRLRERRPGLLTATGEQEVDFLVSTQSLEVGVDVDLPAMVTMIAPASSLAQRAGRLNRSGSLPESTLTVIMPAGLSELEPADAPRSGPYPAEDLIAGARWLGQLGGSISPRAIAVAGVPEQPRPLLPALRAVDLETLELTSEIQSADPDPELYLEDPSLAAPQVGIVARRHLDLEPEVVSAMLMACSPRAHEIASMSLSGSKELQRIREIAGQDAWVVRAVDGDLVAVRLDERFRLLPGDTLVVADGARICTAGIVGPGGDKRPGKPLQDVLAEAPPGAARDWIIPLAASEVEGVLATDRSLGSRAARNELAMVLESTSETELAQRLRRHRRLSEIELRWCGGAHAEVGVLVASDMSLRAVQSPAFATDEPVGLDAHQAAVERRLIEVLDALSLELPEAEREALLCAARCHDEGKRHPRFQHRMGARDGDVALAKPRPGHRPDRGDGWRHEQLSAAWAAHNGNADALVVSLVGAHHGRGRALFDRCASDLLDNWTDCPREIEACVHDLFGAYGRYELLRAAARRRYGVHRLAWLEALLRCADMQVSREGG